MSIDWNCLIGILTSSAPDPAVCLKCGSEVSKTVDKAPCAFEDHVKTVHGGRFSHLFWCSVCNREIGVNSWVMHLYRECECYGKIYEFASSGDDPKEFGGSDLEEGTFRCLVCREKREKEAVFPVILKYEHLRGKHPEHLLERKFYCKFCKKTVSEADWRKHKAEHNGGRSDESFTCPICKEVLEECYEEHMGMCHRGQCPFCKETFAEKDRREHMLSEHGYPCSICDEPIDTLLEVHVKRRHRYFEGHCRCRELRKDNNGGYYYQQCE